MFDEKSQFTEEFLLKENEIQCVSTLPFLSILESGPGEASRMCMRVVLNKILKYMIWSSIKFTQKKTLAKVLLD